MWCIHFGVEKSTVNTHVPLLPVWSDNVVLKLNLLGTGMVDGANFCSSYIGLGILEYSKKIKAKRGFGLVAQAAKPLETQVVH